MVKIILIILLVLVLAWLGTCVYSNFFATPDTGALDMPGNDKASHQVIIKNTGGVILVSDYDIDGKITGSRKYILHGYWEVKGDKYRYVDADIILDESIFGEIIFERRSSR